MAEEEAGGYPAPHRRADRVFLSRPLALRFEVLVVGVGVPCGRASSTERDGGRNTPAHNTTLAPVIERDAPLVPYGLS